MSLSTSRVEEVILVHKRCGIEDEVELELEPDGLDGAINEAMRKVPPSPRAPKTVAHS